MIFLAVAAVIAHGAPEMALAERGKPADRMIVAPAGSGPSIVHAAAELQRYVKGLTGVELPVAQSATGPAIRLEQTDDYGEDGFRITARPLDLVVRGGVRGCLYGVYEILETHGGVGWFASWRTVVPRIERLSVPSSLWSNYRRIEPGS